MPDVSVSTSLYNGEVYLRPALDLLLDQTFEDLELITVDDASTDGTPIVLGGYKNMQYAKPLTQQDSIQLDVLRRKVVSLS